MVFGLLLSQQFVEVRSKLLALGPKSCEPGRQRHVLCLRGIEASGSHLAIKTRVQFTQPLAKFFRS